MQTVDLLFAPGELAAQAEQPPVGFVLLHEPVITEGRAVEILAEVDARQAGQPVLFREAPHPQAVRAVTIADLAQALAQVGKLPHPHGIGGGHARKPQNGLGRGGFFVPDTPQIPFQGRLGSHADIERHLRVRIIGHGQLPAGELVDVDPCIYLAAGIGQRTVGLVPRLQMDEEVRLGDTGLCACGRHMDAELPLPVRPFDDELIRLAAGQIRFEPDGAAVFDPVPAHRVKSRL